MNFPPRVKTQFPNMENIINDEDTPIPIESAFFLEDAENDIYKANRYYFNFPGNWITSNNGEIIVGVRSIWMIKRKRRLDFTLDVFKIKREIYEKYQAKNPTFDVNIIYKYFNEKKTNYTEGKDYNIKQFSIVYDLLPDDNLNDFHNVLCDKYEASLNNQTTIFDKNDIEVYQYYDANGYHISIDTPHKKRKEDPLPTYLYYFRIYRYNDDFRDVFNLGKELIENRYSFNFKSTLIFDNLWDRSPCKIFSSLAEQSLHQYIGPSNMNYNPIKYFKIKSTDQRFWVDLMAAAPYNLPVKLPKNESFCIEMQFLPFNKILNI